MRLFKLVEQEDAYRFIELSNIIDKYSYLEPINYYSFFKGDKMQYKVKRAQLHQVIDLKGVVSKKTLSPENEMAGAELFFNELGLVVKFKGETFIIPAANVAGCVIDE